MWWKFISIVVVIVAIAQYWTMQGQIVRLKWQLREMTSAYLSLKAEHKRYVRKRNTKGQFVKNNLDK